MNHSWTTSIDVLAKLSQNICKPASSKFSQNTAKTVLEQLIVVLDPVLKGGNVLVLLQVMHHEREVVHAFFREVQVERLGVVLVADLLVDVEGQCVDVLLRTGTHVLQLRRHRHPSQQHRYA